MDLYDFKNSLVYRVFQVGCGKRNDHPCSVKLIPGRAQPALVLLVEGNVFSGNMGATNQKTERIQVGVEEGRK